MNLAPREVAFVPPLTRMLILTKIQGIMSLKYKYAIVASVVDLLLYVLLFHPWTLLPVINPHTAQHTQMFTSFPRDFPQQIVWIGLHVPLSIWIDLRFGDSFLSLSIIQTGALFFGIGTIIDLARKRNGSRK